MTKTRLSYFIVGLIAVLCPVASSWSVQRGDRRVFVQSALATVTGVAAVRPTEAAVLKESLLEDLKVSKEKIGEIPSLLDEKEWDKVRSILKLPPVNKLWNLGDSQNVVLQLAKETGNVDLFELKDDLAYSLQMCDQLTYNNVFVNFQPGNGKVNIKEPKQLAVAALQQIQQAIDLSNE